MESVPVRTALISVSDRSGLDEFALALQKSGAKIIASGGTAEYLRSVNITTIDVADITGVPSMLGGRVKTLHPKIAGGILSREGNASDESELAKHGIRKIDLVVVNFYPFKEAISKPGVSLEDAVENIDIGGPTLLRAAAKNHSRVAAVFDPSDYPAITGEILQNGGITKQTREKLAAKAFAYCSSYDFAVSTYLNSKFSQGGLLPDSLGLSFSKFSEMRYGENPHQNAAYYFEPGSKPSWKQLWGKGMSYNNILDMDAAVSLGREFCGKIAAILLKHNNPCGVALGTTNLEAYTRALKTDTVSPYGGIVCFAKKVEEAEARKLIEVFTELVIAPAYSEGALEALKSKKNLRIIEDQSLLLPLENHLVFRSSAGGMLAQESDSVLYDGEPKPVTIRKPSKQEMDELDFAWRVCKHTKSNAVVYTKDGATVGIGAGQTSRVDSAKIAIMKANAAGLSLEGCAMASDAFFPFPDAVEEAAKNGIISIIQPGGSIRDAEVIKAADERGIAMVFTGMRHTWH